MKKLAGLVIILAVLILGGYYGMGVLAEKAIKKNVAIVNQTNGLYAKIQQYNRGWFTSDAMIQWRLHVIERVVTSADGQTKTIPPQDYEIEIPVKIYHGPFIFANKSVHFGIGYEETTLTLPANYAQKFDEVFSQDSVRPVLNFNIFINYMNMSTIELALPSFKLIFKDGTGEFEWKGLNSTTTLSSNLSQINGKFAIDGMSFLKEDSRLTMGTVNSNFELHKTSNGLYLGSANFSLPSFTVSVKGNTMLDIKEVSLNSDSDITQNRFNTSFNAVFKSIDTNGLQYGPGELKIAVRNLDADVLATINKQASAMQNGTDAERQQALMALIPELPRLFSKGAQFEISKANLKLPEGLIEGNMLITLPEGNNANPFELLQKVQGNARLKMPKAIVKLIVQKSVLQQMAKQPELQQVLMQQMQNAKPQEPNQPALTTDQLASMQADNQISAMEQNGIIKAEGTDYVTEIILEKGKVTVNGKPFDPSIMK